MRMLNRLLLIVALCAVPVATIAQDVPKPAAAEAATQPEKPAAEEPKAASPAVEHKDASKTIEHLKPDASTEEVVEAAFATIEEAQKYFKDREASTKKAFMWAALVAALLKLLIALIRRTSPFWKKTRGKWVVRLITLTLGAAAGVISNLALGMPWWDAVVIFFGGPGAVLLTEYQKMIPFLTPKKEGTEEKADESKKKEG